MLFHLPNVEYVNQDTFVLEEVTEARLDALQGHIVLLLKVSAQHVQKALPVQIQEKDLNLAG